VVVFACTIGAGVARVILTALDDRLAGYRLPERARKPVVAGTWAAGIIALVLVGLALHAPRKISEQYHKFVETAEASPEQKLRANIFDPSNRGLLDNWRVAIRAFKDKPLTGHGAATYEVLWNQDRPAKQSSYNVTDGHSLYLEALAELGIVGFLLLATFLVSGLVALLPFRRGPNRALYAALFATALAWVAHAGADWDWEMPAVTVGVFALMGAAMATHERELMPSFATQSVRVVVGIALLAAAIAPGLVLASQRRLNDGLDALRAQNCHEAIDKAADSIATLKFRPEAYEVIGLCQAKNGRPGFAAQALEQAVKYDPDNWRYRYELASVQGAAGIDPRPELSTAHRLNPHNPELNDLLASIPPGSSATWDLSLTAPGGATGSARP
jgi:hypothetical protein